MFFLAYPISFPSIFSILPVQNSLRLHFRADLSFVRLHFRADSSFTRLLFRANLIFANFMLKKNVPRHILAPSAVACDIFLLRASAHPAERFLLYRKCDAISYKVKRMRDSFFDCTSFFFMYNLLRSCFTSPQSYCMPARCNQFPMQSGRS